MLVLYTRPREQVAGRLLEACELEGVITRSRHCKEDQTLAESTPSRYIHLKII